jgi:hypothetical protein
VGFACALRVCAVRIARALRLEVMVGTLQGVWDGVGGPGRDRRLPRRVDGQDERFSQMSVGGGARGVADGGGEAVGGDGDGTGRVSAAIAVEQLDQGGALAVGQGQASDGHGIVIFGEDEATGPRWGGRPPSDHLEDLGSRVFRLQPYVQNTCLG